MIFLKSASQEFPTTDNLFGFTEEKHYAIQLEQLSNYLLLGDIPDLNIKHFQPRAKGNLTNLKWINRGELIAGSFMAHQYNENIPYSDVDVYFHSEVDARDWLSLNNIPNYYMQVTSPDMCGVCRAFDTPINLIWGVQFKDAESLLTRFDIRAISIAFNPNTNMTSYVQGAISDCRFKRLIFNPVPRGTSIARILKYSEKEFEISPKQRLFFANLVQSALYNPELELKTGYPTDTGTGY